MFNLFLMYLEVFQISQLSDRMDHFKDPSNILDFAGISLYLVFAANHFIDFNSDGTLEYFLTISMMAGVMRGIIALFNLHSSTRFIMEMMILILKETIAFLIVYLGMNVYFTIMFIRSEKHNETFTSSKEDFPKLSVPLRGLLAVWNLGLGSMEYKFETELGCFMYFLATLLSVIISLNVLISVVSDYYDLF